ncbi:MAG: SH3 domain-containing protein [Candidatus Aminicenantes bacterium]|nr:SH3 domain-containing protein [Candidatus Aminicenantes bacterium]
MRKTILLLLCAALLLSVPLLSQQKKLRVIDEKASIHLEPDKDSAVAERVEKGTLLTLLSKDRIKESWYYVSFRSEDKYITISGFIHASAVEEISEGAKKAKEEKKRSRKSKKATEEVKIQVTKEVTFDPPRKVQVILESANIRANPNFESEIVHQIEKGLTLLAVGKIGEWFRVDLPPDEEGIIISGFIHQTYIREIRD